MVPGKSYALQFLTAMRVDASDPCIFEPGACNSRPELLRSTVSEKGEDVREDLLEKLMQEPDTYGVLALSTCSSGKEEERIVVLMVYERK